MEIACRKGGERERDEILQYEKQLSAEGLQ